MSQLTLGDLLLQLIENVMVQCFIASLCFALLGFTLGWRELRLAKKGHAFKSLLAAVSICAVGACVALTMFLILKFHHPEDGPIHNAVMLTTAIAITAAAVMVFVLSLRKPRYASFITACLTLICLAISLTHKLAEVGQRFKTSALVVDIAQAFVLPLLAAVAVGLIFDYWRLRPNANKQ